MNREEIERLFEVVEKERDALRAELDLAFERERVMMDSSDQQTRRGAELRTEVERLRELETWVRKSGASHVLSGYYGGLSATKILDDLDKLRAESKK